MVLVRRRWGPPIVPALSLSALIVALLAYTKTWERLTFWGGITGVLAIWWLAFWWAGRDPRGRRTRVVAAILRIMAGAVAGALAAVLLVVISTAGCDNIECGDAGVLALVGLLPIGALLGAAPGGPVGFFVARGVQRRRHGCP